MIVKYLLFFFLSVLSVYGLLFAFVSMPGYSFLFKTLIFSPVAYTVAAILTTLYAWLFITVQIRKEEKEFWVLVKKELDRRQKEG